MFHRLLWGFYKDIPLVTRIYTTACVIIALAVTEIVSLYNMYFNPHLIVQHFQWWRILTPFLYLGTFNYRFLFNILYTYQYCRKVEEGSHRRKSSDFVMMLVFGAVATMTIAHFANVVFMGQALAMMTVSVWSFRNLMVRINFCGVFNYRGGLVLLILLVLSFLAENDVQVDIIGITVGRLYYFVDDGLPNLTGGIRLLKPPCWLKALLDPLEDNPTDYPEPQQQEEGQNEGQAGLQVGRDRAAVGRRRRQARRRRRH